jgi:hypothetical protein
MPLLVPIHFFIFPYVKLLAEGEEEGVRCGIGGEAGAVEIAHGEVHLGKEEGREGCEGGREGAREGGRGRTMRQWHQRRPGWKGNHRGRSLWSLGEDGR